MSLSVCLLTREPASRVAALLEPLRALADEVVLAADDRVGADTLAGYAALADRLFTLEFRLYERHLAWLHRQCSCDWILRLDGDEVPSAALVRRLPELLARRDVHQYVIRRAWLYRDGATVLDALPWSTDHLNRLVRNDGLLRFAGHQHGHAEPAWPRAYVEEPVYHLELLLADERARRAKAIRYEVARPLLLAPGGGRCNEAFYLPELRGRLRTRPVAAEDALALARALAASAPPVSAPATAAPAAAAAVRHVTLAESDAAWAGRTVDPADCRASLRALEEGLTFLRGERRDVLVEVVNEGGERWPGGLDEPPLIRLSYRWLRRDGAVHTADAIRTPFPAAVAPGATTVAALDVAAPDEAGAFVLEVDVVHEHVRWFGSGLKLAVTVEDRAARAALAPRLRETGPPRGGGELLVPRLVHRVWLGDDPMPADLEAMGATFAEHNPGWELRLWGDRDLPALGIGAAERARARSASELSNVVRYEVLRRFGGVYVDTDVECRRALAPLLGGVRAFAALELPGRLGTAVLGAVPGHPLFERAAAESRTTLGLGAHSADANGPYFLTLLVEQERTGGNARDVTIFGAHVFFPYGWDEPERAGDPFPDAHAVHHWSRSWWSAP